MAFGVKVGSAYIDVGAPNDGIKKDLNKIKRETTTAADQMKRSFNNALAGIGIGFAVKKVFDFAVQAKNAARDAEEVKNKFNEVFSSIQAQAQRAAQSISRQFDLANSTSQELLGTTGDLLVGFGFTEQQALDMSVAVNKLAVDLASFSNVEGGAEQASMALTKGLLGERESMKLLGIAVNENTEEFKELVKQHMNAEGASLIQAKALATLDIAYKQSEKAIGDYGRTQDSLANQERQLEERFKELKIEIGNSLIPIFNDATSAAIDFLRVFTEDSIDTAIRRLSELGVEAEKLNSIIESKEKLDTYKKIGELLKVANGEVTSFNNIFGRSSKNVKELTDLLARAGRADLEGKQGMLDNRVEALIGYYERLAEAKQKGEDTSALQDLIDKREIEVKALGQMVAAQLEINKLKEKETTINVGGEGLAEVVAQWTVAGKTVKEIEAQIKKLKDSTEDMLPGSKEFVNTWKQIANLKDIISPPDFKEAKKDLDDLNEALADSLEMEFDFMDDLIAKDEERAQRKIEHENTLADVRREMDEEEAARQEEAARRQQQIFDDQLSAASQLGYTLQRAFDPRGDKLLSILNQALQMAIRIQQAIESMNRGGSATTGGMNIASSVFGFIGSLIPGFSKGGTAIATPQGLQVKKKAFGGMNNFKVPGGFYKDDYLIGVKSGEKVTVEPNGAGGNNFSDRNIVRAIIGLAKEVRSYNYSVVGAMANRPPHKTVIMLPNGKKLAEVTEGGANVLEREGVNKSGL